jgi:hypothetical protein
MRILSCWYGKDRLMPEVSRFHGIVRVGLTATLVLVGLFVTANSLSATPVIFDLTSDHCSGGCGTPPFGTITLNQNGTTVDVTVHLTTGYSFVKTGSADFQNFKFNDAAIVLGNITVDQTVSGQTLAPQTAGPGAFNGDGTGNFTWGIACTTCSNGGSGAFTNDIVFHVAMTTVGALTGTNNLGIVFVADVLAPNGNTGPVDASTPRSTPEPDTVTVTLFGLGVFGVGVVLLRKKALQY